MSQIDPNRPEQPAPQVSEVYVEPVERRSSPLPLIVGILLALAVAYFVLQYFMKQDGVTVVEPAAVTTPAPNSAAPDTSSSTTAPAVVEGAPAASTPDATTPDATTPDAPAAVGSGSSASGTSAPSSN